MRVEIWSDVVCPWCYLGKRRFENALAQVPFGTEVEVVHRSFQLDPSAPTDHTVETKKMLATKYGMSPERADAVQREMEERAAADGLEYHLDGQEFGNTFTAHRLLQLARERGRQSELIEAMYRAYFTEQQSVFDDASLTALAVEAGLEAAEVSAVLNSDQFTDAVEADIEQAREYGISGVPFYVLDGKYGVSGAQSTDVFVQALEQAHAAAV
ncbi:DsbA family oxidoreductase [Jatrophihabitans sp.]|uniref:DsbA family oxidoreductase n=1 Tax=Jatrophihabitans sp. TaxID=1932789 RepID=UPI0030C71D6F|nr:protein-disulfide isomerase [Jatrophihabitans sp.]